MNRSWSILLALLALPGILRADPESAPAPKKDLPFPGETYLVKNAAAFVMLPAENLRRKPQPWIWYAPTLPGLPDAHEKWMHEKFLAAGIAVAGIDVGESYGGPQGRVLFTDFYRDMTERRGFATRPVLLGRSRGGLMICSWAVEHPEAVAGVAGIYPVFDFRTYPGLEKAAPAYGMTARELDDRSAENNPIERLAPLAKAAVPAFLIHGDVDTVVPLKENSAEFVRRYEAAGAANAVKLVVAKGQGHNFWEGFFRSQELVDFAIARAREGARENNKPDAGLRPVRVRFLAAGKQLPLEGIVVEATSGYGQEQEKFGPFRTDDTGTAEVRLPQGFFALHLNADKQLPYLPVEVLWGRRRRGPYPDMCLAVRESGAEKWLEGKRRDAGYEPPDEPGGPPRITYRLLPACELVLRAVDAETGRGLTGAEFYTENAVGEDWAHSIEAQNVGPKSSADDERATTRNNQSDSKGNFRRLVGANAGYTYGVAKSPSGYEAVGPAEIELEIVYGQTRAEHVFKFRRID